MTFENSVISEGDYQKSSSSTELKLMKCPIIHIIIPVYNESKSILSLLNRIYNSLKNQCKFKITVIDDGSEDDTYSLLKHSKLKINLKRNKKNKGKGYTLKKGFRYVKKDEIVVILDGDGEHPPEEIPKLIQPILMRKADLVIGSRFLGLKRLGVNRGSYLKNKKRFSKLRKFGNTSISWFIFLIHHKFISDSQSGFRAFAPSVIENYSPKYSRFEVETEMTISFIKKNLHIVEVPIDSGLSTRESHMHIILDSLKILYVILDMKLKEKNQRILRSLFNRYYLKSIINKRKTSSNHLPLYLRNTQQKILFNPDKIINSTKLSIVIPCYNEANTILPIIHSINNIQLSNYEVIIVDDGSTDHSVQMIKGFKNIKMIIHEKNEGYGKSLIDGILASSGEIIITIDSDGQHNPNDIPKLCEPIIKGVSDIVVGSRYAGKYFYRIPFVNRFGEAFIEVLIHIFFGYTIKNNQGGFRAFHKRTIDIFKDIKFLGMAFTTEILIKSFLKGYEIVEYPINLHERPIGKSRVKKIRLLLNLLRCFIFYSIPAIKVRFGNKNNK